MVVESNAFISMDNNDADRSLKHLIATLPSRPGVYLMLDGRGKVLYVGKARHLKKRVSSYFIPSAPLSIKNQSLVAQVADIQVTVTPTESEALLLENTLIKTHQPRYNILLRDDKSYPYVLLSAHLFPRLSVHRGAKRIEGQYFGPYPHAHAVQSSIQWLQKVFRLRSCTDTVFKLRSRPCLQYQIKRCTAPCVGLIEVTRYQEDVKHAVLFLQGKSQRVIDLLRERMQAAAETFAFEQAAQYRDQIQQLCLLQQQQCIDTEAGNVDVLVSVYCQGIGCVQLLTIRDGRHLGNQAFFPQHTEESDASSLLTAFLSQYYLRPERDMPDEIVLNSPLREKALFEKVIQIKQNKSVQIHTRVRGIRARWIKMALENAQASLAQRQSLQYRDRLAALAEVLQLPALPQRLECFDVSHMQGEAVVASCVVFGENGMLPAAYRHFNIEHIIPGDDCGALQQALRRRFAHAEWEYPAVLFVDGGQGQVNTAKTVLNELRLTSIHLVGVAKGEGRKPGLETLLLADMDKRIVLPPHSPALHFVQHIRDEAHRFAIIHHRKRSTRTRQFSVLEHIAGIGTKRRQQLIKHFGGLQGIMQASIEALIKVPGINRQMAQRIHDFFANQ